MKKLVTILMLQAIALSIVASIRTIEQPDFMSLSADGISIERIEFAKRSTVLTFRAVGEEGNSVGFLPSVCLVDEEGHRYPAKGSKGLKLGKLGRIGKDGSLKFSISFEPLPEGTRVFDCLESPDANLYKRFYAICPQGQEWGNFAKRTVQDIPFPNSAFRVDTVLVTGRIVSGEYNRLRQRPVHMILSSSQRRLLQGFRDNRGAFDFLHVEEDGTFSFKTVVAGPSIDVINLYGTLIPVLLVPDDHVRMEISDLGEFNQQVSYTSRHGDYGNLLRNIPFLFERELNESSFLKNGPTLFSQSWVPLHAEQKKRMDICDYISSKYGLTKTEKDCMLAVSQTGIAMVSVMRMFAAVMENYSGARDSVASAEERYKVQKRKIVDEWGKSGVCLDMSFLKEVPMDNPAISVSPFFESLVRNLSNLSSYVLFAEGSSVSEETNISAMVEQLGYSKDAALAIAAFHRERMGNSYSNNGDMKSVYAAAKERKKQELQQLAQQIGRPHLKVQAEALAIGTVQPRMEYYQVGDEDVQAFIQSFAQASGERNIVIFPVHEYSLSQLKKMEIGYRLNCSEFEQKAFIVPLTTKRYMSRGKLRQLQQSCPMLNQTVYVSDECYLRLRDVLQFQFHQSNERIFSPDGQTYRNAEKSFFGDRDKKW